MTAVDAAITVALIGGFLVGAIAYHRVVVVRAKELALEAELRNLRAGLAFFQAKHRRNPQSLGELMRDAMGRARVGGGPPAGQRPAGAGEMADAFGNRYAYDPEAGTIQSLTKGYETW